jgi:hypothetical protein
VLCDGETFVIDEAGLESKIKTLHIDVLSFRALAASACRTSAEPSAGADLSASSFETNSPQLK